MALSTKVALEFLARNKSAAGMRSFERGVTTVTHRLRGLMTTALAVAGVGGFGYMIKRQMEAIDSTAKLSDRLGIATEALVGLQHGAKISGVETGTLNKALSTFSSRLGEVDMGVGQARYSLDKLGLNYRELIGLKMDEAFAVVADRIRALSTQSEKAAAANYLFGKSGKQLLNLFEQGSAGIEAYRREAEKLGLAFTRIDAAKVEAANDALTRTRAVFTGLFRQTTIELAPYIEAASTAFVEWAIAGEGVGAKVTSAFEIMTIAIIKAGEELERLVVIMGRLASPIEAAKKNIEAVRIATQRYREVTGEGRRLRPGQPELFERLYMEERMKRGLEVAESRELAVRSWFENLRQEAEERAAAAARRKPVLGLYGATEDVESAEKKKMDILRARVREEIALTGRLDEPRQHAKMIIDYQAAAMAEYGENSQRAIEVTRSFRAELKQLEQAESLARIAESIGQSFTTAFEDAILEAQNLNDVLNALAKNIQKALFQEFVSRPLSQAISSMAGSLMGLPMTAATIGHGGGIIGDIAYRRMVPSTVFENAPRFHDLAPNEVAVIAQRGEEIRRPGGRPETLVVNNYFYSQAIDRTGMSQLFKRFNRELMAGYQAAVRDNNPERRK